MTWECSSRLLSRISATTTGNHPPPTRPTATLRHADFYAGAAGSHPSVVMYAMSHNATGYNEDMNPDLIDGKNDPRDTWSSRNAKVAVRAEAIVKNLDPGRIVYHHASGNLGSMHPINFYPNFVPIQELSDWFGHWATEGVKPVFLCEYGAPFTWDWTMYRGWFNGKREFGSAVVPWEFCLAEWNAQFIGDRAFQISEAGEGQPALGSQTVRAPASSGIAGTTPPTSAQLGSTNAIPSSPCISPITGAPFAPGASPRSPHGNTDTSGNCATASTNAGRNFNIDWDNLQRPGFSPDYVEQRYERMDLAFERADWIATPAAQALLRNNRPLLAYIGGKPAHFTSKDHNFLPGETVEKQLIVINNSRETGVVRRRMAAWFASSAQRHETVHRRSRPAGAFSRAFRTPLHLATRPLWL